MKKILLNFCCIVTLCVTVWADGYLDILSQAEKWINVTYQPGSIANRRAKRTLEKIDEELQFSVFRENLRLFCCGGCKKCQKQVQ